MIYPDVEIWNGVTVNLGQALLGVISPNMRSIALSFENDKWMIRFVLAQENAEDLEEIGEALTDFESMDGTIYACEIQVSQDSISVPPLPGRLVYLRRETPYATVLIA